MTMVRPGGGEVVFKEDQDKQDCIASCLSKGPNKDKFLRKLFLAAGLYITIYLIDRSIEEFEDYRIS